MGTILKKSTMLNENGKRAVLMLDKLPVLGDKMLSRYSLTHMLLSYFKLEFCHETSGLLIMKKIIRLLDK